MKNVQFFVGGCSGSGSPANTRSRSVFGTETTALAVAWGAEGIFIDNGTGVSSVAKFLSDRTTKLYGLQTHYHEDHRSGIQGNGLLYRKGLVGALFAPRLGNRSFESFFDSDFHAQTWPISPALVGSPQTIKEFEPGDTIDIAGGIKTLKLHHPGGAVAYRIATPAGGVVISTDHELTAENSKTYAEFVSSARLLYVDVQYRAREYFGIVGIGSGRPMSRVGWGHSIPETLFAALKLCEKIPNLILIGHHDPERTDADLCLFENEIKALFGGPSCEIRLARQGEEVELKKCA